MDNFNLKISIVLLSLLLFVLVTGGLLLLKYMLTPKYDARKASMTNAAACRRANFTIFMRNWTDYFWSDYMRAAWIMLFLVFFIALGFALANIWSLIFSLILVVVTIGFIIFARKSYINFPIKATARLKEFEDQVKAAIEKEITFEGDNIQIFSNKDDEFDTKPKIFTFPTDVSKIPFPPLETRPPKQPIVATRKLEFLVLSREYFSTCQGAGTFNLLKPKQAPVPKKCAEAKGTGGECNEYYYSQMQNVEYKDGAIHIVYYGDIEDAVFKCKKGPDQKNAMKALKEKLRLTERQRLHKIDEHEKYENIKDRRAKLTKIDEKKNNESDK